jgi:hypothetical protein
MMINLMRGHILWRWCWRICLVIAVPIENNRHTYARFSTFCTAKRPSFFRQLGCLYRMTDTDYIAHIYNVKSDHRVLVVVFRWGCENVRAYINTSSCSSSGLKWTKSLKEYFLYRPDFVIIIIGGTTGYLCQIILKALFVSHSISVDIIK